jgi:hypothetical protein
MWARLELTTQGVCDAFTETDDEFREMLETVDHDELPLLLSFIPRTAHVPSGDLGACSLRLTRPAGELRLMSYPSVEQAVDRLRDAIRQPPHYNFSEKRMNSLFLAAWIVLILQEHDSPVDNLLSTVQLGGKSRDVGTEMTLLSEMFHER